MAAREALVREALTALAVWSRVLRRTVDGPFAASSLTRSQREALFLVAHAPGRVTPGRLARALGLTAGAVTQLLDGLRDAGLVVQQPNPDDARSRIVTLSPQAHHDVEAAESAAAAQLTPHFDTLSDSDLGTLVALLSRTAGDQE